ncbi:MAG: Nif3-like dinuclear metal center hexameric protein [Bacteroidetes bacterium]|nr:MAG: Nif3-like dinuclear metal center hexameric protein [Bacteroidota bacterium]
MKIKEITQYLESIAPLAYQESYDNSGLIVGNPQTEITGILICLDSIEDVLDEALAKNCNVIIAHHPIIFGGLKKITGKNYVEKIIIKAIKNDLAIYAIHTNLDNVWNGVNAKISDKLGLKNQRILLNKAKTLRKLTTFVPVQDSEKLLEALAKAGAGNIGNYSNCSFLVEGTGTFLPNENANAHIGKPNQLEKVKENRIEVIFPVHLQQNVLNALQTAHPYEEVAYYLHELENQNQELGSGMIGELENEMTENEFLAHLKQKMGLKVIKHTKFLNKKVKKVAVCGGTGSFLLKTAISNQADVFVSADFKYHEFFDADHQIMIADIGHYESEIFTCELLKDFVEKRFLGLEIQITKVVTNPVEYFL